MTDVMSSDRTFQMELSFVLMFRFAIQQIAVALHALLLLFFLPARRYASAGLCDSDVSVRPSVRLSVRPSVCLSHAGIVPSRAKAGS